VQKVGRWDTTGAFLGGYALLEFIRNQWLGWTPDVFVHKMMSGSLLLFSFFMITDPRAIPDRRIARIIWSLCVAILTYVLRNHYFIATAPFWALFALSPLTILFDRMFPAKRFEWNRREQEKIQRIGEVQCQPNALPS
jgi:Na+-transporting NADH:ubiquinone oxidoreductase subunit NqrB